ncbi:orotidine-5'-phosphate decarboxylase [Calidifontibacillus erzurumensis]|uniref:Orotidine 5'-phosphate decarboxylase n=1 Tax=Calidifontibacillus erzurumensis TaxID=2741433 RepID=A0A8J8K7Z0_9BACI|nr:orotidine-5'-phosphate decarboxylase [Calidifontibacillus erzurumensis]NSL51246.1 orotidine-5'-phosphate decarboxylase [Calidifontibacillus erzurumensis]
MPERPLIVALDFPSISEVKQFLGKFEGEKLYVKVGMELFYKEGAPILAYLKENGHRIFLDLKLHDIPNTVKSAMRNLASFDVDLVNVHAAGGKLMMEAALEGLDEGTKAGQKRPACIAVTQLTSTSAEMLRQELLIQEPIEDVVVHYAKNAKQSGLDGVVCSTWEVENILDACGTDFLTVTPGIRLKTDQVDDQVRIATPEEARKRGSWGIVVGRPITRAENPLNAYITIRNQWEGN